MQRERGSQPGIPGSFPLRCPIPTTKGNMAIGKRSKPSYVYAIIGVSLVLFLLGTLGWLVINGRSLTREFKENITVVTDFHDNVPAEKTTELQAILDQQPFTKHTRLISKEEALKLQSQIEGENIGEFLGYNPLFASIELNVYAEYANKDSLEKIRKFILQSNVVREVTYPTRNVEQMNANFRRINIILGAIALLLVFAVVVLIDNTVRLAMFSNRFLIKTMQMVGANRFFISRPFDRRSIINGLISGIIAVAGLWLLMQFAESQLPELRSLHDTKLIILLMLSMLILGVLISWLSTHRSVLKYLKMKVDDLY
ncbi:MAG: cell division protein FtsX [Bacteroidetes bacterium]|nr:cell division protein FtsX [Bacteroidota bacterium]MBS1629257.1 cell division protein FtsX [Bacteroidota bacterium]